MDSPMIMIVGSVFGISLAGLIVLWIIRMKKSKSTNQMPIEPIQSQDYNAQNFTDPNQLGALPQMQAGLDPNLANQPMDFNAMNPQMDQSASLPMMDPYTMNTTPTPQEVPSMQNDVPTMQPSAFPTQPPVADMMQAPIEPMQTQPTPEINFAPDSNLQVDSFPQQDTTPVQDSGFSTDLNFGADPNFGTDPIMAVDAPVQQPATPVNFQTNTVPDMNLGNPVTDNTVTYAPQDPVLSAPIPVAPQVNTYVEPAVVPPVFEPSAFPTTEPQDPVLSSVSSDIATETVIAPPPVFPMANPGNATPPVDFQQPQ